MLRPFHPSLNSVSAFAIPSLTRFALSRPGSGHSMKPSMTPNTAVFAPMPKASVSVATTLNRILRQQHPETVPYVLPEVAHGHLLA
jgi:hypothetical protein